MAQRGQQQYVVVTKRRKKSGCIGGIFHLFFGLFTFGLWPAAVWLWHLIGPKRKEVATVYATNPGPPQVPQTRSYVSPEAQPWNQPQPAPAPAPPQPYPSTGQQPPEDPWDTGQMATFMIYRLIAASR